MHSASQKRAPKHQIGIAQEDVDICRSVGVVLNPSTPCGNNRATAEYENDQRTDKQKRKRTQRRRGRRGGGRGGREGRGGVEEEATIREEDKRTRGQEDKRTIEQKNKRTKKKNQEKECRRRRKRNRKRERYNVVNLYIPAKEGRKMQLRKEPVEIVRKSFRVTLRF